MKKYAGLQKAKVLEQLEEIKYLYYIKGLGLRLIAQRIGVSYSLLHYVLKGINFQIRSQKEAVHIAIKQGNWHPWKFVKHKIGAESHNWKGGRKKHEGYIYIYLPKHERAEKPDRRYVREHIYIWEKEHKEKLPKGWIIHHLNGIRDDNRIENLLAMPSKKHRYIIPKQQERIRQLEAENKQFREALEQNQMLFTLK